MSYPSDPSERSVDASREAEPGYANRPGAWPPPDDEISLFDIWDALVRRRWLILAVFVAVSVLAAGYALTRPDVYRYQAALQVGQAPVSTAQQPEWPEGVQGSLLAATDSVVAQLETGLIPKARRVVLKETDATSAIDANVQVEAPQDSGVIRLSVESSPENDEYIKNLLAKATGLLIQDHAGFLESERKRLNSRQERLAQQRGRISDEIDQAEDRIARLVERGGDATSAIALRVDRLQQRIGSLRDRLLDIQDQRAGIAHTLAVLSEQTGVFTQPISPETVSLQQDATQRIAAATDGLRPTRVIAAPERSQTQVGTSATLIVALGMVLGAMLGIFAAFLAEFISAARRRHET